MAELDTFVLDFPSEGNLSCLFIFDNGKINNTRVVIVLFPLSVHGVLSDSPGLPESAGLGMEQRYMYKRGGKTH